MKNKPINVTELTPAQKKAYGEFIKSMLPELPKPEGMLLAKIEELFANYGGSIYQEFGILKLDIEGVTERVEAHNKDLLENMSSVLKAMYEQSERISHLEKATLLARKQYEPSPTIRTLTKADREILQTMVQEKTDKPKQQKLGLFKAPPTLSDSWDSPEGHTNSWDVRSFTEQFGYHPAMALSVEVLDIPERLKTYLKMNDIRFIGELTIRTMQELYQLTNVGVKAVASITEALRKQYNLTIGNPNSKFSLDSAYNQNGDAKVAVENTYNYYEGMKTV